MKQTLIAITIALAAAFVVVPSVAAQANNDPGNTVKTGPCGSAPGANANEAANGTGDAKKVETQYCTPFNESSASKVARGSNQGNDFIAKYITPAITALSALAGIFVAGSIIFGGIQYTTAGGDSSRVAAAKQRILKAILVLVAYIFFYQFMKWILPDGGL